MSLAGVIETERCPDNSKLSIAHINAWAYHTAEVRGGVEKSDNRDSMVRLRFYCMLRA